MLVNNLCCDAICMTKIFAQYSLQIKNQSSSANAEILSKIIPQL